MKGASRIRERKKPRLKHRKGLADGRESPPPQHHQFPKRPSQMYRRLNRGAWRYRGKQRHRRHLSAHPRMHPLPSHYSLLPRGAAGPAVPFPDDFNRPGTALGERRKWERVSLGGTKAHAVLTELGNRGAKVLDLSYGGVALLVAKSDDLPEQYNAVLNVPILPPVRVLLRRI